MGKYFDKDGNEVEAFTQEEVDAKVTEKETALNKAHEEAINKKDSEIKTATDKITELEKGGSKKDEDKTEVQKLQERIDELEKNSVNDKKESLLRELAGDDKDLREKIELEYNQFNQDDTSEAAIEARMLKAVNLAQPEVKADSIKSAMSSMAAARGKDTSGAEEKKSEKTKEQAEFASNMGITKEDEEKYGAIVDESLQVNTAKAE